MGKHPDFVHRKNAPKNLLEYCTGKQMAAWLRKVADDAERRDGKQAMACNVQMFYMGEDEFKYWLSRIQGAGHGEPK